jgi:hypothetical protein
MNIFSKVVFIAIDLTAMWLVGTRMGIDLVALLWRADMTFESIMTGFFAWTYVINVGLSVLKDITELMTMEV